MTDFVSIPEGNRPPDDYYSIDRSRIISIFATPYRKPLGVGAAIPDEGWHVIANTDIGVPAQGPASVSSLHRWEWFVATPTERDRLIRILEGEETPIWEDLGNG